MSSGRGVKVNESRALIEKKVKRVKDEALTDIRGVDVYVYTLKGSPHISNR